MRIPSFAMIVAAGALALAGMPARAFDDAEFCVAAKEFVRSVAGDVGTWTDRFTRNDGVEIGCDLKTVHFKRYYKAPASALRDAWKESQAESWESTTCSRSLWRDAVGNGWVISATVTTATGERIWLACLPNGRGFYRMMP
ncbi:MAG TPA: hypothetical protein VG758_08435 [Hyphomicrobiaceae bacterium]|jgi:hypothetical protein|nr:hypothetical protein [Hyphomicrobiaceae bacterium]